jgi:hypothetical protein
VIAQPVTGASPGVCRPLDVAKALAFVAVAGGLAVASQRVLLPRASPGQLTAARVEGWLIRHRVVRASRVAPGQGTVGTTCAGGWPRNGLVEGRARVSFLIMNGRRKLVGIRGDAFEAGPRLREDDTAGSLTSFELAGCPWWLARQLGNALDQGLSIRVVRAVLRGRQVFRLALGPSARRVDLYVSRRTYAPLAIRVAGPAGGWASLRAGTETQAIAVERSFASVARLGRPTV